MQYKKKNQRGNVRDLNIPWKFKVLFLEIKRPLVGLVLLYSKSTLENGLIISVWIMLPSKLVMLEKVLFFCSAS